MSLINKMLKDLEARQHAPQKGAASQPIYQDLHPVAAERARRNGVLFVLVLFGTVILAAGLVTGYRWLVSASAGTAAALSFPPAQVPPVPARPIMSVRPIHPAISAVAAVNAGKRHRVIRQAKATHSGSVHAVSIGRRPQADRGRPERIAAVSRNAPPLSVSSVAGDDGTGGGQIQMKIIPMTAGQVAENAYRRGVNLLQQGRRKDAETAFKTALASDPRNVKARELFAGVLLEDGRRSAAATLLAQGLSVLPHESSFAYLLARIDAARGAEPAAIAVLEKNLPDAGSDPDYLALLATLDQRAGRNADAANMFSRALALRPLNGNWWIGLGISLEAQKRWAEAREAYTRATMTRLDPALVKYADERLEALRFR